MCRTGAVSRVTVFEFGHTPAQDAVERDRFEPVETAAGPRFANLGESGSTEEIPARQRLEVEPFEAMPYETGGDPERATARSAASE